jgi:hypothetical protein
MNRKGRHPHHALTDRRVQQEKALQVGIAMGTASMGELSEPEWPDKPLTEILQIAFRDRIVDSENHPVVRRLRGLA